MLIDAVKNKITAGEVKHDITGNNRLATDVCRDINQAAGQFSAMQKVVLQAAADHHLEICGGGAPVSEMAASGVCDNERYQRTLENFGYLIQQATVLVSMSMLVAPVAMTPFICCTACHGLCRTSSPFPPRHHICKERIRVCLLTTEYFSAFPDNGPMPVGQ